MAYLIDIYDGELLDKVKRAYLGKTRQCSLASLLIVRLRMNNFFIGFVWVLVDVHVEALLKVFPTRLKPHWLRHLVIEYYIFQLLGCSSRLDAL